jgi:hypothetical protein
LEKFDLPAPSKQNISQWINVIDSWIGATVNALSALKSASLEQLLLTEAKLAQAWQQNKSLEASPPANQVPSTYATLLPGQERKRQTRLGWWDRFQTADGLVPEMTRLVVAGTIVGSVLWLGATVGYSTLTIYNGLAQTVAVQVGQHQAIVQPGTTEKMNLSLASQHAVQAKTSDGVVIETFEAEVKKSFSNYVYNVASASPLVEWTAVYGNAREKPDRPLGAPRWFQTNADVLFKEPPDSVETSGGGASRDVLMGFAPDSPNQILGLVEDEAVQEQLIATQARWASENSPYVLHWLELAKDLDQFPEILAGRLRDDPLEVVALRTEQDMAQGDNHREVCDRHQSLADASTDLADLQYLVARCLEDQTAKDQAFLQGLETWPDHGWFALAAGYTLAGEGRWSEAAPVLQRGLQQLPSAADFLALDLARIERVVTQGTAIDYTSLSHYSQSLSSFLALETGQGVEDTPYFAYAHLAQGDLEGAIATSAPVPAEQARLIWLAAASDGAGEDLIEQALALPLGQGVDQENIGAVLGLVARRGQDLSPYLNLPLFEEDGQKLLAFLNQIEAGNWGETAERELEGLVPSLRGQAYAMATVLLQQDTPADWRTQAKGLLFALERPHFD